MSARDEWAAYKARATREHGDRLDLSDVAEKFLPWFRTGDRIKVRMYDRELTGTVGITTGWKPALLLMRRSNAHGSSELLTSHVELLAVKHAGGSRYVPVVDAYVNRVAK